MNKIFATSIGCLLIMSCTSNIKENKAEETTQEAAVEAKEVHVNIIKKDIPFAGEFYQITNLGSTNIEFTEGDYAITAEGPENLVNMIRATVDTYVLTLSLSNEEKIDINKFERNNSQLIIHVSCPELKLVATCSTGTFKSVGSIHTSSMHVGILSTGSIMMDSVITTGSFKYEGNGDGDAEFKYVRCENEATLLLGGAGNTTADFDVSGRLLVENDYRGNVSISGKATNTEILSMHEGTINVDLTTDNMEATAIEGKIILKGKYKNEKIHESKRAKITRF